MIAEELEQRVSKMKRIKQLESMKNNRKQQEAADALYRTVINNVCDFSKAFIYADKQLDFGPSVGLKEDVISLIAMLKTLSMDKFVVDNEVKSANTQFSTIKRRMVSDWTLYINRLSSTREILRIVENIEPVRARECLEAIRNAESWTTDLSTLQELHRAIELSGALIGGLDMDAEIVGFLGKMSSGQATLADVSGNVQRWIMKENLEGKVKVSFS